MEMIKYSTVENMVSAYQSAVEAINKIDAIYRTQNEQLEAAFDQHTGYRIFDAFYRPKEEIKKLKARCWHKILDKTGIMLAITEAQQGKIVKDIEADNTPDITVDNVHQMLQNLLDQLPGMLTDLCKSVFDTLTPARYGDKYKTNKVEIGNKAIIKGGIEFGFCFSFSRYYESRINDIDKAFHLLDGKGLPKRENSFISIVEMNYRDKRETTGESEYLRYKAFNNGNLHLEFKRPDLVKELNRIGADGTLKH